MCMSSVGRLVSLDDGDAVVDVDGAARRVSAALLVLEGTAVEPGDWLLVHTGFAVARLDPDDAAELVSLRQAMAPVREEGRP